MRRFGINLATLGLDPAAADRRQDRDRTSPTKTSYSGESPLLVGSVDPAVAAGLVETLRRLGVLTQLTTTPSQTTTDGRACYFLTPPSRSWPPYVSQGFKESDSKKFGDQLDVTPTLLGERRVRLDVQALASELEPEDHRLAQRRKNLRLQQSLGGRLVRAGSGRHRPAGRLDSIRSPRRSRRPNPQEVNPGRQHAALDSPHAATGRCGGEVIGEKRKRRQIARYPIASSGGKIGPR